MGVSGMYFFPMIQGIHFEGPEYLGHPNPSPKMAQSHRRFGQM